MKKFYLLCLFSFCFSLQQSVAQRFVTEVFTDDEITIEQDVVFGVNLSVLGQIFDPNINQPTPDTLMADIYMPDMAIDDLDERPVIIINGAGNSLPIFFNTCFGDKRDPFNIHVATEMAKRGYVVFTFNARGGINPGAPTNDLFLATLVDDAIRKGIDYRTAARFIQMDIAESNNTYGINPDQVIAWGPFVGTYAFQAGYITDTSEYQTSNFIILDGNNIPVNVVDLQLSGGVFGEEEGFDQNGNPSNIPNHVEFIEDYPFDLVVTSRALVIDTTGIQPGEPPSINFVNGNNITANIVEGPVNLPATGEFCCNIFFSQVVQRQQQDFGNLDIWRDVEFTDPVANTRSTFLPDPSVGEVEGLFAFQADPGNQTPWMFWDTTACNAVNPAINDANLDNQPGMSPENGMAIIDTMIRYWTPRACVLFGWECADVVTNTRELIVDENRIKISPNPSSGILNFESSAEFPMEEIEIFSVTGALINQRQVNSNQVTIEDIGLPPGVYFAKIQFEDGIATKKVTISN